MYIYIPRQASALTLERGHASPQIVNIYILSHKLLRWNFLQISQLSIRSGAQTFLPIFELFGSFDFNFLKIVAPPSDGNKNCLAVLKGQLLLKKGWKRNENRPINSDTIAVQSISHSSKQPAQIGSINKKKTPHFRTYSWSALYDPSQTLHGDRARADHQKRCQVIFWSNA